MTINNNKHPFVYGISEELDDYIDRIQDLQEIIDDIEENGFNEDYAVMFIERTKNAQLEYYRSELKSFIDNYNYSYEFHIKNYNEQ